MREAFIHEADKGIWSARTPREARRRLRRYLRLAEDEHERTAVARYEEMIHMWETMPRRRPSP
jgi:acyl-CoA reductase-like NAD-dependent aldehyde dehydrogenase